MLATDIRSCDILNLIKKNIANNRELIKHSINVAALDFGDTDLNEEPFIGTVTDVVAGDIIYDNDITEKFLLFLTKLQMRHVGSSPIFVHVAMEKRYFWVSYNQSSLSQSPKTQSQNAVYYPIDS